MFHVKSVCKNLAIISICKIHETTRATQFKIFTATSLHLSGRFEILHVASRFSKLHCNKVE